MIIGEINAILQNKQLSRESRRIRVFTRRLKRRTQASFFPFPSPSPSHKSQDDSLESFEDHIELLKLVQGLIQKPQSKHFFFPGNILCLDRGIFVEIYMCTVSSVPMPEYFNY